jgi:hypothetical protein
MIYHRSQRAPGKQTIIWDIAEEQYGAELIAVVDRARGTTEEQKAWMKSVGIKKADYHQMNVLIHFFAREEDAMLFYLTWGIK